MHFITEIHFWYPGFAWKIWWILILIIYLLVSFSSIANSFSSMLYAFSDLILNFAHIFSKSSNHHFNHSDDVSLTRTASIDREWTFASSRCRLRKCRTYWSLILSYTVTWTWLLSSFLTRRSLIISASWRSSSYRGVVFCLHWHDRITSEGEYWTPWQRSNTCVAYFSQRW